MISASGLKVSAHLAIVAGSIFISSGCHTSPDHGAGSKAETTRISPAETELFARNLETDPLRFSAVEELPLSPADIFQIAMASSKSGTMLDAFRGRAAERMVDGVEGPFEYFPSRVTWEEQPCSAALAGFAHIVSEICKGASRYERLHVSAFHHAYSLVGHDGSDAEAYMRQVEMLSFDGTARALGEEGFRLDGESVTSGGNAHVRTNPYVSKVFQRSDGTRVVLQFEKAADPSQETVVAFSLFRAKSP